jgi:hypothetical protein
VIECPRLQTTAEQDSRQSLLANTKGDNCMNPSTSEIPNLDAANRLCTEVFMRSVKRFAWISSFRRTASLGLHLSFRERREEWMLRMHELEANPAYKGVLVSLSSEAPKTSDWSRVADALAQGETKNSSVALDAASLVFAHSILDDAAFQYCRVTAMVSQSSWERFALDKKIKLGEARDQDYGSLLAQKTEECLNKLERESLLLKIGKLFEVCQPDANFKPMGVYSYDRERLENLDKLRHSIVHGSGPVHKLPNGDDDIQFMDLTAMYLMMLVNARFGVQIEGRELDRIVLQSSEEATKE